jgi:hypothetical protein
MNAMRRTHGTSGRSRQPFQFEPGTLNATPSGLAGTTDSCRDQLAEARGPCLAAPARSNLEIISETPWT